MTEIKESAFEIAFFYIQENKLRKSNYFVRKVHKMEETEPLVQNLAGIAKMTQRNYRMGLPMFEKGMEALNLEEISQVESETVNKLLFHYLRHFRTTTEKTDDNEVFMKVASSVNQLLFGEYANRAEKLLESYEGGKS